jgi:hypothetical protein
VRQARGERPRLVFVYNADSGLFNTASDIAHKLFSPETYPCRLCTISHGYFTQRSAWKALIESLNADCEFLHRDQFRAAHPELGTIDLPAVLRVLGTSLVPCVSARQIRECESPDDLRRLIVDGCL